MAGKLSYMKTCQEKFKRLENSPLGEALRQRTGLPSDAQSDLSDPDPQSFGPMFQPAEAGQKSYFPDSPVQMGRSEDFGAPGNYQGFIDSWFFSPQLFQLLNVTVKFVSLRQLSHMLKRRSPEGKASSMRIYG